MNVPILILLASNPEGPQWSKIEVKTLVGRVQAASRAPSVQAQDTELANVGGAAYGIDRKQGEGNEPYAKRVLRTRDPDHPNVKEGQWLSALMRAFYVDVSARSSVIARFELDKIDRRFFEKMTAEGKAFATQIEGTLELSVDGLDGFSEPLPVADGGDPQKIGASAAVRQQKINIENIDRITFVGHLPPEDASRTPAGSLREVYSAQKQFNVSAQMLGHYEAQYRRSLGHIRVVIPGAYPAIYLNEIARAAVEAEMHTIHLMTMTKRGDLRELTLAMKKTAPKRKKGKKKSEALVPVSCADDASMQECAQRILHARTQGAPLYEVH